MFLAFGDIVLLDIPENMNSGKTHAFFSWAADNAMVPRWDYSELDSQESEKAGAPEPDFVPGMDRLQRRSRGSSMHQNVFAKQETAEDRQTDPSHAPLFAEPDLENVSADGQQRPWRSPIYRGEKRPDYIVKADEDSFIVLGELERRLRVSPRRLTYWGCKSSRAIFEATLTWILDRFGQRPFHGWRMLCTLLRSCLFRRQGRNIQIHDSGSGRQISRKVDATASAPRRNLVGQREMLDIRSSESGYSVSAVPTSSQ